MTIFPLMAGEGGSRIGGAATRGTARPFLLWRLHSGPCSLPIDSQHRDQKAAPHCGQMKRIVERCNHPTGAEMSPPIVVIGVDNPAAAPAITDGSTRLSTAAEVPEDVPAVLARLPEVTPDKDIHSIRRTRAPRNPSHRSTSLSFFII